MANNERPDTENEALKGLQSMGIAVKGLSRSQIEYAVYLLRTVAAVRFGHAALEESDNQGQTVTTGNITVREVQHRGQ